MHALLFLGNGFFQKFRETATCISSLILFFAHTLQSTQGTSYQLQRLPSQDHLLCHLKVRREEQRHCHHQVSKLNKDQTCGTEDGQRDWSYRNSIRWHPPSDRGPQITS